MKSKEIKKFILNSLTSNVKIFFLDGTILIGLSIEGIEWNKNDFFNMWVLRFDNGLGSLIDGHQIKSIINF